MAEENLHDSPATALDLHSCTHGQLLALMEELGQPAFRAKQVEDWVWSKGVGDPAQMTNLPKAQREALAERVGSAGPSELARQVSEDGSRKYLLGLSDGAAVECVGMPGPRKLSVCVSTQAGCAMGCAFCATGRAGLVRSLTAGEIYEQVMHVRNDFNSRVTSVVFMGQGEPFANYDETLKALRKLNDPDALGIGARHLTVSTCGLIPQILKFANEPEQFTLAVSLHSTIQKTRNALMPGVRRFSLVHLYAALGEYVDKTGRRPTYEYALIGGVNDTDEEIDSLCDFCRGTLCHVNIIQLNEVSGSPFKPSTPEKAQQFVDRLARVGVEATIRNSRGADIDAACGQLRQRIR
ncbi:MAG: 23S rRNA (adenine(2503)-C(2))-methyltransferase RlmN [Atopobiaceae bacterium]|nr:23S rRNA (adenine(2503)-C(2))-methyltransferase RlmN [Atopobiaceae bacterium]